MRDLLAMPELRLRLLHGDEASLDRPLRYTYSSDLIDPRRYLSGGELVVSGLVWRSDTTDSETFASNLALAGVAGLAAGEARFGEVPSDVVQACRRHDILLLGVPVEVSFTQINEAVIGATTAARGARLEATLGRYRKLLSAAAEGRHLDELVAQVCAETGLVCRVLTPTGRGVSTGAGPLPEPDLDRITHTFLTSPRLPALVRRRAEPTYSVFGVGPALGQRTVSWLIAAEGDWSTWPQASVDAVGELGAIAQLERIRRDEGLRAMRQVADDAVALVIAGTANRPETVVRLRQAGMDPDQPLAVVVVVAGTGEAQWREEERAILDDATAHLGTSVVAHGPDGHAVALVPAADPRFAHRLRVALLRLSAGMARSPLTVGVSEPAPLSALSGMWEEARHARTLASVGTDKSSVSVVTGAEVTSHVLLLAAVPDDVRRTFADRVLGPVRDYDVAHGGGLQETLTAFLACSCSWSRTAEAMHLHVNSVRYRIRRVEELTGRDLSRLEDRVDVFLALRSLS